MKKQEYIRLNFLDEALDRREADSLRELNILDLVITVIYCFKYIKTISLYRVSFFKSHRLNVSL